MCDNFVSSKNNVKCDTITKTNLYVTKTANIQRTDGGSVLLVCKCASLKGLCLYALTVAAL